MSNESFFHPALVLNNQKKLIYTAFSKHYFYNRMFISKFVLEAGHVPLNPFMLFDYFLTDTVDRDVVRNANNSVLSRADEIWVFGPISNGVLAEILLARNLNKPINFFEMNSNQNFQSLQANQVKMEDEVSQHHHLISNS